MVVNDICDMGVPFLIENQLCNLSEQLQVTTWNSLQFPYWKTSQIAYSIIINLTCYNCQLIFAEI